MVDNVNPTSQFHPYVPVDAVPVKERMQGGLSGMLNSVRGYARKNPGALLGVLAALAIGMGLLRRSR